MNTTTARQSPRIEYQVPVQLAHAGLSERDAIPARTINVSAGGMALGVPTPVAIGETVVCHMILAGEVASLTGEVTWSCREDGDHARVGLRFDHLDAHDSEVLDQLLANAVGPMEPVCVRFEGMEQYVLARGRMHAQSLRLSAPIPILASGTPVDLRLPDGGEMDAEVLDSRLVHIGRTPVIEVDISLDEDGPRARRQTFYGRASKLDTLRHQVAHIGDPAAAANADAGATRGDTEPSSIDATWQRARLHTRRMWQPTPNGEQGAWSRDDETSRDLLPPAHDADDHEPAITAAAAARAPRWGAQPGWGTVLAAAVASTLATLWLVESGADTGRDTSVQRDAPAAGQSTVSPARRPQEATPAKNPGKARVAVAAPIARGAATATEGRPAAPVIHVTANRQQTQVRIPISGRPAHISTHLWKKPVAVVTQLEGASVLTQEGNHRVGRHGVSHVSITGPDGGSQVRVITSVPVANYSVTATAGWLEVRITPQQLGKAVP